MSLPDSASLSFLQPQKGQPASLSARTTSIQFAAIAPAEDRFELRFSGSRKKKITGIQGSAFPDRLVGLQNTQAWKFAALIQQRLMHPVAEQVIAVPESPTPGSQDWNGGVYTYVAPSGEQVRVGRTRNGVDRGGETWVELSRDGGKTWQRKTAITKDDESTASGKPIASVERPYLYGKTVNGEPWIVLGTCAADKRNKCWDILEREAPLARLEDLKTAPALVALAGNDEYAYKDGVPVQAPDGSDDVYMAATRHHIGGTPASAVNADTVLCRLDSQTGRYDIVGLPLPQGSRGEMDKTCNRLSSELVLPDGSRFWGCDIRNVEEPNAALKKPLQPGKPEKWALGDFDEITSFAISTWPPGARAPQVTSVDAILGRSEHRRYPTLRYLGIAPLVSAAEFAAIASPDSTPAQDDQAVLALTYEKTGPTGAKSTYQQTLSRRELREALTGKGPELLLGQDPA